MRRLFVAGTLLISTLVFACAIWAQDFKYEMNQIRERQKSEMKALKQKHKFAKESMKGQTVSKSIRSQMEHEMKREEQALRQKHDHEIGILKDRQRVLRESQGG